MSKLAITLLTAVFMFFSSKSFPQENDDPEIPVEDYHHLLSADLNYAAEYAKALYHITSRTDGGLNRELVTAQIQEIGESLESAKKDLAEILSNTSEVERKTAQENFDSIQGHLRVATESYNVLKLEVGTGKPDTQIISVNAARIYDQVTKAEEDDHESIRKVLSVGILEAPAEIKEDLEMEDE